MINLDMLNAVRNNDIIMLKLLITQGADINFLTEYGDTALMLAVMQKKFDIAALLIEEGANVTIVANDGNTALTFALMHKNFDMAKLLIEKEANVNDVMHTGNTCLSYVVTIDNTDMMQFLITHGADINLLTKDGNTALIVALFNKNFEMAERLIEKGADINIVSKDGYTPLMVAVQKENLKIVNLLIEKGADVNAINHDGYTALMLAVREKKFDMAAHLIKKGADINIVSKDGDTALIVALREKDFDTAELLIEKGANVNTVAKNGDAALIFALKYVNSHIAERLIEKGADINTVSNHGNTALMVALIYRNFDMAKLLIEKDADINFLTEYGYTAFMMAVQKENLEIVKLLIKKGSDINMVTQGGNTALIVALIYKNFDMARLLIDKGANINIVTRGGNTALLAALQTQNLEIVKLLIAKGADINVKISNDSDEELDVITYALKHRQTVKLEKKTLELVELLVAAGADPLNMVARLSDLNLQQDDKEQIINIFRLSNNIKAIAVAVSMVSINDQDQKQNNSLLVQLGPETGEHDVSFARKVLGKVKRYFSDNSLTKNIPTAAEALQEVYTIITSRIIADESTPEQFKQLIEDYKKENKTEPEEHALRARLISQLNPNDANQKSFQWLVTLDRYMMNLNNPDSKHAKDLMLEMLQYIIACRNNLRETDKSDARSSAIEEALINQLHNLMLANQGLASCVDGTPRGLRGVLEFYLTIVQPKTPSEQQTEQFHKSVETLIKNMLREEWEELIKIHQKSAAKNDKSINLPELQQELILVCEAVVTLGLDNYSRAFSAAVLNTPDEAVNPTILDNNLLGRSTHEPYDKHRLDLRRKIMYDERYPTEHAFIKAVLNHMQAATNTKVALTEEWREYLRQMYIAISNENIRKEVYGYTEGGEEVFGLLESVLEEVKNKKLVQDAPIILAKLLPIETNLNPLELAKTKHNIRSQLLIIIKDLVKHNKLLINGDFANDVVADIMQTLEQMPKQPAAILRHLQETIDNHLSAKSASPKDAVPDSISNLADRILKFNTTSPDINNTTERIRMKNDLMIILKKIPGAIDSEAYQKATAIIHTVLRKDNATISTDWTNRDKIHEYLLSQVNPTTQPSPTKPTLDEPKPGEHKPSM